MSDEREMDNENMATMEPEQESPCQECEAPETDTADVFPARAGMNRDHEAEREGSRSLPRTCGDEPW